MENKQADKTLAQFGYEAAAAVTGCKVAWQDANKPKWQAAAAAIAKRCAESAEKQEENIHRSDFTRNYELGYLAACLDISETIRALIKTEGGE